MNQMISLFAHLVSANNAWQFGYGYYFWFNER